jgi:hypothetical protein
MGRKYDDYEDEFEMRRDEAPPSSRRSRETGESGRKAPVFVRLLAWTGVLVFCFAAGYVGTSVALRMLNRQDILLRKDVAADREQAEKILDGDSGEIRLSARRVSFTLYYPKDGNIVSEKVELLSGIMEDDIRQMLAKLFAQNQGRGASDTKLLNVFRSGDTLYLNFNPPFLTLLSNQGEQGSALFITGVVQTMSENFSPIVQVRFLVDGKEPKSGAPVDLTVPWRLPRG